MAKGRHWIIPALLICAGACALFFSLGLPRPGDYLELGIVGSGKYRLGEMITVRWRLNREILRGREVDVCFGLSEVDPPWDAGLVSVRDLMDSSHAIYFLDDSLIAHRWEEGMPVPVIENLDLVSSTEGDIFFIVTSEIEDKTFIMWAILVDHATGEFIDPVLPVATTSDFTTSNPARPDPDQVSIDGGGIPPRVM